MDIIEFVRKWTGIPIIVVSARTHETDKVAALDAGTDDYITKPFGTEELLARVRTALRHARNNSGRTTLYIYRIGCGLQNDRVGLIQHYYT